MRSGDGLAIRRIACAVCVRLGIDLETEFAALGYARAKHAVAAAAKCEALRRYEMHIIDIMATIRSAEAKAA